MRKKDYFIGCNYWASNQAIYMWRNYDKKVVEQDMQCFAKYGINLIRVFPLWPDFQPLTEVRYVNKSVLHKYPNRMRVGDTPLLYQKFPESGLDEQQVGNMCHLLATAKKYGIKVILSLLTGWMSGRKLMPEPFISRDLVKDSEILLYECAFIRDLISQVKDFDNIIAYEPGNETNCLSYEVDAFESECWMKMIVDTIRLSDSTRPIYAGMHGTNCKGAWSLPTLAKYFDMVTPHPYPAFTPYCQKEKLTSMRASLHIAAENAYYHGIARKPSMVEEVGDMGPMFLCNEESPNFFEKALITSYMTGSEGLLWWCAFEQDHLNFAPYDLNIGEVHLGLAYADYTPKPILLKLAELRKDIDKIGVLPPPKVDAVAVITNLVEPWKVAYGSFMLGVQSGNYIDYMHEEQSIKDADYYILPSLTGLACLSKYQWEVIEKKIENGAKLLITCDCGKVLNFEKITGLKVYGREMVDNIVHFKLNGKEFSIKREMHLELKNNTANVIAYDEEGNVVIAENHYGKGNVMFVNAPIESAYTQAYYPENSDLYEIYNLFFKNRTKIVDVQDKYVFTTIHELEDGRIGVMLYNFNQENNNLHLHIANGYRVVKVVFAKENKGIISLEKNYAYLELVK